MTEIPFPLSANLEGELSESNPITTVLRSKLAAMVLLLVSTLQPLESFANTCTLNTSPFCLDSVPCKQIGGVSVCLSTVNPLPLGAVQSAQPCWQSQTTYNCINPVPNDTCGTLKADPTCGVLSSNCTATLPNTTTCSVFTDTYQCQTGGGVTSSADCSGLTFCSNGTCFTKNDKPNNTLTKVVTAMELSRQAGFYMDPNSQSVFKGSAAWCSQNNLGLANCCKPDSRGATFYDALIVDQLVKAGWNLWVKEVVGSSYTYDTLFDQAERLVDKAIEGMEEVVGQKAATDASINVVTPPNTMGPPTPPGAVGTPGAGVGGVVGGTVGAMVGSKIVANAGANKNFTGVAGAVGYVGGAVAGAYLGAGGYALVMGYGTGFGAGTTAATGAMSELVICWACIIAVAVIMIIMALLACEADEIKTQLKLGANLCHNVGAFCSLTMGGAFTGGLKTCITTQQNFCCFNSRLAKIVQEQGRPQIGKAWGDPHNPDCSGYSIAELQTLDFSKMDLSEFFSDVVNMGGVDPDKIAADVKKRLDVFYLKTPTTAMTGVVPPPPSQPIPTLTVGVTTPPKISKLPACNIKLVKQIPASNGDTTGTITLDTCLPNGTVAWAYTGNCNIMQNSVTNPAVNTLIDATGATTFTVTIPSVCLAASTPAFANMWNATIIDTATGGISGKVQALW